MATRKKKADEVPSVPEVREEEVRGDATPEVQKVTKYLLDPQMYPEEIAYWEEYFSTLPTNARIVEWGSGGSTTMFLDLMKDGQQLVSIEHNDEWYDKVSDSVKEHPRFKQLTYIKINIDDNLKNIDFYRYGSPYEENPVFIDSYIAPLSARPDLFNADVFFVDGIARAAILATIRVKANSKAEVFIHDYAGRETWYEWAVSLFWKRTYIAGTLLKLTI